MKSSPSGQKRFASGSTQVRGQATRPALVALIVGAWVLALAVPALAKAPAWKVVPSPSPGPAAASDELNGISCVSAASCTAVGDSENRLGTGRLKTLIESWNGRRWSVVPSPNPDRSSDSLGGVSCVSARSCTAAGFGTAHSRSPEKTLIESWNGKTWSVVPSPDTGPAGSADELDSVSCASAAFCTAVGSWVGNGPAPDLTLIESWNGKSWSVRHSPNPAADGDVLYGVSCVSAIACTTVGFSTVPAGGIYVRSRTLIESWNGKTWSAVPSPNPGKNSVLHGVSCVSAASCTATGSSGAGKALIESWNGKTWSVVPSPTPGPAGAGGELNGVSCVSAASCTASGDYENKSTVPPARTLIESWNGKTWSVVPSPNPRKDDYLVGVSCVSATACTAAGDYDKSSGATKTLIESD